jgi:hypothetical protein
LRGAGIGRAAAGARLHLARQAVARRLRAEHLEDRIEQRQVDHLPAAAVHLDFAQRDHRRGRAVQPGIRIGHVHRRQHRLAVGKTVERGESRNAFDQGAEARTAPVRAGLAPTRDAHDHKLRVPREHQLGREAHLLQRVGAEALHQDGGRFDELQQQRDRLGLAQLEREALLVAGVELPVQLHAFRAPRAQRVARLGLDLDHFGAEIGEHAREGVAGHQPREVEDANASEGPVRVRCVLAFCEH